MTFAWLQYLPPVIPHPHSPASWQIAKGRIEKYGNLEIYWISNVKMGKHIKKCLLQKRPENATINQAVKTYWKRNGDIYPPSAHRWVSKNLIIITKIKNMGLRKFVCNKTGNKYFDR